MNKRFVGMVLGAIIVVVSFLWLTQPSTETDSSAKATNHTLGKGGKGVTLLEYGDYQCPACGTFHPVVKQIVQKYEADIIFQFRNYPLEAIHTNARAGSRAAEAANLQGKFWEMHDMLYENQSSWSSVTDPYQVFKGYAQQIGVADLAKFETDYRSSAVNDIINADLREGQKIEITSTPTFILDGKVLKENPNTIEAFYKLIDDAIAAKSNTSN